MLLPQADRHQCTSLSRTVCISYLRALALTLIMNTQTLSRAQCLASQICKSSSMRPRQAAHLGSVQRTSQSIASSSAPHISLNTSRRHLAVTRAESGNGASPAPSGLAINLKGKRATIQARAPVCNTLSSSRTSQWMNVAAGKKAFIAGVADDQACVT